MLLGREPRLRVWEDNEATIKIVRSGRFPTMRHVKRVHGVSICSLHDSLHKEIFSLEDCHTDVQAADSFTKHFTLGPEWDHRRALIGILEAARLPADRPQEKENKTNKTQQTENKTTTYVYCCVR